MSSKEPENSLRVSNDVLTAQLRQVLRPGTNVTFDTTHVDYTLVSSAAGYPSVITNPQDLDALVLDASANITNVPWTSLLESATPTTFSINKVGNKIRYSLIPHAQIYNSATVYPASLPFACVDPTGIVYSTSPTSRLENVRMKGSQNSRLAIESTVVSSGSNVAKVPITMGRSSGAAFIVVEQESLNVPTISSLATVNGVTINKLNFSGAQTLATLAASHDDSSAFNISWDCTLVFSADIVPGDSTSKYLEFTGNNSVYSMAISNSPIVGNLSITCGEVHTIPYLAARGVYVVRISQTSAFTSYLDVFMNGSNIYSRPFSSSLTAKSLGLAGLLRLGDSTNTASTMSIHHLSWYDFALSDDDCFLQSQYIATTCGLLPTISITSDLILSTDFKVRYIAAAGTISDLPTSTNVLGAPYSLSQSNAANKPLFNSYSTFNYRFVNSVAYMDSGALAGTTGSRYSIVVMFAPGGICSVLNDLATLTLNNSDFITIIGSYSSSVLTLGLKSGATQKTLSLAHKAATNDELALVLNCNNNVYTLTAIRFDTKECASCSIAYTGAGVSMNKLTIGRTSAPATVFPFNIGDIFVYTRILPGNDAMSLVDALIGDYSLPMSSTPLLQ